jgi:hypothetical protein
LLEGEVRGLGRELARSRDRVLGERARRGAEHLVARPEPRDAVADRFDASRDVLPEDATLGPTESEGGNRGADQVRQARHDVPVPDEQARPEHAEQHLAGADLRPLDLLELQDIGRPVLVEHDRLHGDLLS